MDTNSHIIAAAIASGAQTRVYETSPGLDHFLFETRQLESFYAIAFKAGASSVKPEVAIAERDAMQVEIARLNGECDRLAAAASKNYKDNGLAINERYYELEADNARLREALNSMHNDSEECLDFDEFTAMLIPIDTWNTVFEALAATLEQSLARIMSQAFEKAAHKAEIWEAPTIAKKIRAMKEPE